MTVVINLKELQTRFDRAARPNSAQNAETSTMNDNIRKGEVTPSIAGIDASIERLLELKQLSFAIDKSSFRHSKLVLGALYFVLQSRFISP